MGIGNQHCVTGKNRYRHILVARQRARKQAMSGLSSDAGDGPKNWGPGKISGSGRAEKAKQGTAQQQPRPDRSSAQTAAANRTSAEKSAQSETAIAIREHTARLTRTIETEIIPRLLLANSVTHPSAPAPETCPTIDDAIIDDLAVVAVRGTLSDALRMVDNWQACGITLESVFLDILAPTARRLGEAWDEDTLSFAEVTIGLGRLQELLRELSPIFENHREPASASRRILVIQAPGEHHTLGLAMIESFFRRAGWDVVNGASLPKEEVLSIVRTQWVDVIGYSKSCDTLLEALASDITSLRRASCNKNITVMVGGSAFTGHPERVILVGADATATDGRQAVWQANRCIQAAITGSDN
jgi:MerR family transcriptional regulator, light-induced transcriptional regulator